MTAVLEPIEIEVEIPFVPVSIPLTPFKPFTPKPANPATPTTIADTLYQAADIMQQGWTISVRHDGDRHCALGAIERVHRIDNCWCSYLEGVSTESVAFVGRYLTSTGNVNMPRIKRIFAYYNDDYNHIDACASILCDWNNHSNQATVVATFREAAKAARKLGV